MLRRRLSSAPPLKKKECQISLLAKFRWHSTRARRPWQAIRDIRRLPIWCDKPLPTSCVKGTRMEWPGGRRHLRFDRKNVRVAATAVVMAGLMLSVVHLRRRIDQQIVEL